VWSLLFLLLRVPFRVPRSLCPRGHLAERLGIFHARLLRRLRLRLDLCFRRRWERWLGLRGIIIQELRRSQHTRGRRNVTCAASCEKRIEDCPVVGVLRPNIRRASSCARRSRLISWRSPSLPSVSGVPCDVVQIEHEQPYQAIIDTAEKRGCDVIVMASHGRRGASAIDLGSETVKVLTHSVIPVVVVRGRRPGAFFAAS
jgi:hypothetical protein